MNIIKRHKVERDVIKFGEITLVRLKNYSSIDGITNIRWKFEEDMKDVKPDFSERLEARFLKSQRKKATVINLT